MRRVKNINDYTDIKKIGDGAFGAVYEASGAGKKWAIKTVVAD